MRAAAIDLGTNTCLLLVGESCGRILVDKAKVTRFGQGWDATLECLRSFRQLCDSLLVTTIRCVATSAARDMLDIDIFLKRAFVETGITVDVITGAAEARLGFSGALLPDMDRSQVVSLDIGGGSTELMAYGCEPLSLNVGALRYQHATYKDITDILSAYEEQLAIFQHKPVVAIAGTATMMAALMLDMRQFDAHQINGLQYTYKQLESLLFGLAQLSREELCLRLGDFSDRVDTCMAGGWIMLRMLKLLEPPTVSVSTRGLRYALLAELLGASV